ncbi:hypothetical protein CDQ92_13280 [Sphingopyxis bauzanensis]|uniref:Uncharacterized protein n=1 Tax=Sphingopyxis bauzanensis TaxID=651663 RepID=A0A246JRZ2_9SPHN|nr:hypothetical protein [Sphingopyxis bauzanensis]OWQ95749.1 hypothetical protein CDQ92_13280 [Sphingopyxis bauzanensis]GGJ39719.1 hypothetical protein GCM10011393_07450 [Sphingopyxis bauzanensis]
MADQSVRITDLPTAGSAEDVAFRLWQQIRYVHKQPGNVQGELELYAQCLNATKSRKIDASQFT